MSASTVDRARELLEAATPGPWRLKPDEGSYCEVCNEDQWQEAYTVCHGRTTDIGIAVVMVDDKQDANAALIAAAPQLLADLLAEVGRLERERDGLRRKLVALDGEWSECERMASSDPAANAFWECRRGLLEALNKGPADGRDE